MLYGLCYNGLLFRREKRKWKTYGISSEHFEPTKNIYYSIESIMRHSAFSVLICLLNGPCHRRTRCLYSPSTLALALALAHAPYLNEKVKWCDPLCIKHTHAQGTQTNIWICVCLCVQSKSTRKHVKDRSILFKWMQLIQNFLISKSLCGLALKKQGIGEWQKEYEPTRT